MRKTLALGIALGAVLSAAPAHAYKLMGVRWPDADIPVKYALNAKNVPGVSETSARAEVQRAFKAWEDVPCSKIAFTPDTRTVSAWNQGGDQVNKIFWIGSGWQYGQATLGVTTPMYYTTGEIFDADIVFNAQDYTWTTGTGNYCQNYCTDLFSIAEHEEGHFFGLDHSNISQAVMYASYPGFPKQTLADDDKQAACAVYPVPSPGTVQFGGGCVSTSDCQSGLSCAKPSGGTSSICTHNCATACPQGYSCQAGSSGQACFVATDALGDLCKACGSGSDCASGLCVSTDTFAFCTRACTQGGCPTGYTCYDAGGSSVCVPTAGECANNCGAGCPQGQACVQGSCQFQPGGEGDACPQGQCGTGLVCVSDDGTAQSATCRRECTTPGSAQGCPTGQTCYGLTGSTGGACFPTDTGNPTGGGTQGATCTSSSPCATGFWCVATSAGASSGLCVQDCNPSQATCQSGLKCNAWGSQAPAGSKGGYCYGQGSGGPTGGTKTECQACSSTSECIDGLSCVGLNGNGKVCHRGCTGNSTCGAGGTCSTTGLGSPYPSAVCECSGDKKNVGDACESTTECGYNQTCADDGSGKVCHANCTAGQSTCASGQVCRAIDGTSVCAQPAPDTGGNTGGGDDTTRGSSGCGGCSGIDPVGFAALGSLAAGLLRRRRIVG